MCKTDVKNVVLNFKEFIKFATRTEKRGVPKKNTNDSKSDVYPDLDLIYNDNSSFKETSFYLSRVKKRIRFQI